MSFNALAGWKNLAFLTFPMVLLSILLTEIIYTG